MLNGLFASHKKPEGAEGERLYAVGDVHGRLDLLKRLMDMIAADARNAKAPRIVYLGDYIDRGPESKGVVERLLRAMPGFASLSLRGNHEQSLLDFLEKPSVFDVWQNYGARATLTSYGVEPPRFDDEAAYRETRDRFGAALPPDHLAFFRALPLSLRWGDYFFTHGGVKPGVPLDKQLPADLLWIREEFLGSDADFGAVVVHGHTPTSRPVRQPNRIGIDTGAYYSGRLTAAVFERASCRFLST